MLVGLPAALLLLGQGLNAQEVRSVTLDEALAMAREEGAWLRAAEARADAAEAGARQARAWRRPALAVGGGALRTDDPVAVFGTRLRQGVLTEADFDPSRLTEPDARADWSASLQGGWTLLDPAASGRSEAARLDAEAALSGARWTEREVELAVRAAWARALAARERREAADTALAAAREVVRVTERRVAEGTLTRADGLRARAEEAAVRSRLSDADAAVADRQEELARLLGWDPGTRAAPAVMEADGPLGEGPVGPLGERPVGAGAAEGEARLPSERRPDLAASAREVEAARALVRAAERARWPSLQATAQVASHASAPSDDPRAVWMVGVQFRLPLFQGGALGAGVDLARARAVAAAEAHRDRLRAAAVELNAARRAERGTAARVVAAEEAWAAAEEAARLLRLRHAEGMATTADVLSATARAAVLRTDLVDARLNRRLASARLHFLTMETDDR